MVTITVNPSAHGASHAAAGNDPIVGALDLGASGTITLTEIAEPAAPAANKAVLYVKDVGGVTTLCVRYANGNVIVINDDTP